MALAIPFSVFCAVLPGLINGAGVVLVTLPRSTPLVVQASDALRQVAFGAECLAMLPLYSRLSCLGA